MAKGDVAQVVQLAFDYDELLNKHPGELVKLPVKPDDIGGQLLGILSKGLYTNSLDCIREYVQNSVDAGAKDITIRVTGNSVTIYDQGNGMNLAELVQARQFGLSGKSMADHVGFRGIGIYSGFDLCRRLRITTTKENDPYLYTMVFDFEAMKVELEKDTQRQQTGQDRISLIELLSEHTRIKREQSPFAVDRQFTTVELQDISDIHIKQLSNRTGLRKYLLQNLPIDFDDNFDYKATISQRLSTFVPGYKAIKITLQADGVDDEVVTKPPLKGLQEPVFGYISAGSNPQAAYYWACMNRERARVQAGTKKTQIGDDAPADYEGFVYKVKGFTVGDRNKLRTAFARKAQLYSWYTGEIYVIDHNVIPNAERDDFETNQAKRSLEMAVNIELAKLETQVETFQASGVASERVDKYQTEVDIIEEQVNTNTHADDFVTYSRLDEIGRDLRRQKIKVDAVKRPTADDLTKRIDSTVVI